jgi:hypothetical protein
MSRFEPGRHLGIWKKKGNLGYERKEEDIWKKHC